VILLVAWLAASLLVGACWVIVGLMLGEPSEAEPTAIVPEADDEAA
jgi:hypothetical protein